MSIFDGFLQVLIPVHQQVSSHLFPGGTEIERDHIGFSIPVGAATIFLSCKAFGPDIQSRIIACIGLEEVEDIKPDALLRGLIAVYYYITVVPFFGPGLYVPGEQLVEARDRHPPCGIEGGRVAVIPVFQELDEDGLARIFGAEAEFTWALSESLLFQLNYSYIDSEYDDYEFNFVRPIAGFSQMRGNQTPRQPKHSGNTALTWNYTLFNRPSFLRGDLFYQGESFVDESNLAKIPDYWLANARAGIDINDNISVELFVTNLFEEEAWMTAARWTDFSSPFQSAFFTSKQGVAVTPLDKREWGLRAFFRF